MQDYRFNLKELDKKVSNINMADEEVALFFARVLADFARDGNSIEKSAEVVSGRIYNHVPGADSFSFNLAAQLNNGLEIIALMRCVVNDTTADAWLKPVCMFVVQQ